MVPIKKGVKFDCDLFDVRCKQPCVSRGARRINNCPYDNYRNDATPKGATDMANPKIPKGYQGHYAKNADGTNTLIMVTTEKSITGDTPKGVKAMPKDTKTTKPTANTASPPETTGGKAPYVSDYDAAWETLNDPRSSNLAKKLAQEKLNQIQERTDNYNKRNNPAKYAADLRKRAAYYDGKAQKKTEY